MSEEFTINWFETCRNLIGKPTSLTFRIEDRILNDEREYMLKGSISNIIIDDGKIVLEVNGVVEETGVPLTLKIYTNIPVDETTHEA